MRKVIEAGADIIDFKKDNDKSAKRERNTKALAGLAAYTILHNSSKDKSRRKLMNDIMYYLRKLIGLAKQVQNLSEGTDTDTIDNEFIYEFNELKAEIDNLEDILKEKPE